MNRRFYEVYLYIGDVMVSELKFKSINQVGAFVRDTNMNLLKLEILTPNHRFIDPFELQELWNA